MRGVERKREVEGDPVEGDGSPYERTDEEPAAMPYPLDEGVLKWLRHAAHQTQPLSKCCRTWSPTNGRSLALLERWATLVQELVTSTPPTAAVSLRMSPDWAGMFMCPYFGCGFVGRSLPKLHEHWAAHNGMAAGGTTFLTLSATPTVDPERLDRAPAVRDPHAISQDGVAEFDLQTLRVGSSMAESVFRGHLTLSVNVLTGQMKVQRRLQVGSAPLRVEISALGLEDVLLWANRTADAYVDLVVRARAAVFSGPWDAEDAADTRVLIMARMHEVVAHSFLFCLASNWVDEVSVSPEHATAEARHGHSALLCADLRKALVRRDLLNRGWTDEALTSEQRLWRLLARPEAHAWEEQHVHIGSCALAHDAPQLRFHYREGGVVVGGGGGEVGGGADSSQTPNPTAALLPPPPPRPPTITVRSNGAAAAVAAAVAGQVPPQAPALVHVQVAEPAPAPTTRTNGGSSWHRSRSGAAPSSLSLLTEALFGDPGAAEGGEEAAPALEAAPVYKPKTAYQLYHKYTVAELKRLDPTIKHQQAFKKAGQMWSEMSLSEQAVWKARADVVPKRKVKKAKIGPHILLNNNEDDLV